MNRYVSCLIAVLIVGVTAGCSSDAPLTPGTSGTASASTGGTASVGTPQLTQPANGLAIPNAAQPVTLIVQNAVVTQPGSTTYTFEVATDSAFATKVQVKNNVAEGSSGQTGVQLDQLPSAKDYFWHVRATGGGTSGVFGVTFKFTIGPTINISQPVPVSPLTGAHATPRPAFIVTNATRTGPGGAISYKFEVSTTSTFATLVTSGTVSEGVIETEFVPPANLPASGTLFWRATPIDVAFGAAGVPSAVQSFTANGKSEADVIAGMLGAVLWPGVQPPGGSGHAHLGENWEIQTMHHLPTNTFFQSPSLEMLRLVDLSDRGLDPPAAIDFMNGNGYPTVAFWYPPPEKAVIGLVFVYIGARDKILFHPTWDVTLKVE